MSTPTVVPRPIAVLPSLFLAATLVAQTAVDLLMDPGLVDAAWREFRGEG